MMNFNYFITFVVVFVYLEVTLADKECDKSKCPGPVGYYKSIDCKPVYKTPESCCPDKYDCDHLKNRSANKCYLNGHEYNVGDGLSEEDQRPCDIGCVCIDTDGGADFSCAIVDCFRGPTNSACYYQHKATECCPGEVVCPEKPEDRPTCLVDGKYKYLDGEAFQIESDPDANCYCGPGYTGENVAPWCLSNKKYCQPEMGHANKLRQKCAPVYYSSQSPQTSCSVFSRCQNAKDEVIPYNEEDDNPEMNDMYCEFGNLTMHYGDELNQATDYSSVCVKCVCEVGPTPTCQRLPGEKCDISKHEPFNY